ncbi:amino acid ABC transporter substrate-binding protein [Dethiosulfatarculus sandiegensis]|uniref:Amino acid ABC transporter substrate-binding protein n=1 Tax=Dethiosulfatarculus sandiegensis TaxID=1429043 RepID=A0A0D2GEE1_9BACT|nr:amino acid ABC transporter substrate-binding protein [Dethiosulfatarculus sandiegensis]
MILSPAGIKAQEIIIGAPTSLASLEGEESCRAAQMAVEQINASGGVEIKGRKHKLLLKTCDLEDFRAPHKPGKPLLKLKNFILSQKPQALLVGPFRSEVFLKSMDLVSAHRLPCVASIAMTPAVEAAILANPKNRFIFRTCLNSRYLAAYLMGAMEMIREQFGFRKVYILNQDVAWARSTASLLSKVFFEKRGWQVLGQENLIITRQNADRILERVARKKPRVILVIFDQPEAAFLVPGWRKRKIPALMGGFISPLSGPGSWAEHQGQIAGFFNMVFELGNLPSDKYQLSKAFYHRFNQRFGRPLQAGHGPAPAYESVFALAEAIKRADSLDPEKLVKSLIQTNRQGVMGRLRFHRAQQAVFGTDPQKSSVGCVFQWTNNGERRLVFPSSIAQGGFKLPWFVGP